MSWTRGKIWKWVVIAATVSALSGALADVATGTLFYWYLLVPAYVTIAMSNWRDMGDKAQAARRKALLARLDAEEAQDGGRTVAAPQPAIVDAPADDPAAGAAPIVSLERQGNVGSVLVWLFRSVFVRGLATVTLTFICMVMIWAGIAIATWGRGYWYIYGPVFAGIGWFIWTVVRSGPADAAKSAARTSGERIVR